MCVSRRGLSDMSNTGIFVVGLFAFLLLGGGFGFSVLEVQRLGREGAARKQASRPAKGTEPTEPIAYQI